MAYHQERQKGEEEKPRKPEKMSCIFKSAHLTLSPKRSCGKVS
jgi:hypothetical protein